jgi:hypothetical protein
MRERSTLAGVDSLGLPPGVEGSAPSTDSTRRIAEDFSSFFGVAAMVFIAGLAARLGSRKPFVNGVLGLLIASLSGGFDFGTGRSGLGSRAALTFGGSLGASLGGKGLASDLVDSS